MFPCLIPPAQTWPQGTGTKALDSREPGASQVESLGKGTSAAPILVVLPEVTSEIKVTKALHVLRLPSPCSGTHERTHLRAHHQLRDTVHHRHGGCGQWHLLPPVLALQPAEVRGLSGGCLRLLTHAASTFISIAVDVLLATVERCPLKTHRRLAKRLRSSPSQTPLKTRMSP